MIKVPALRLVLVDVDYCPSCRRREMPHLETCYLRDVDTAVPATTAAHIPTSRELFAAAQSAGDTVGHQWDRR